jgi:hypothetical protein
MLLLGLFDLEKSGGLRAKGDWTAYGVGGSWPAMPPHQNNRWLRITKILGAEFDLPVVNGQTRVQLLRKYDSRGN